MKLYAKLSQVGFLKDSYAFKFLFVAFLGIHLPLIGIIFFLLFFEKDISPMTIFAFTLCITLAATGITLLALKKLIRPISLASKALDNYRNRRAIPSLPVQFTDEAGLLLSNIQGTVKNTESLLHQKEDLIYLMSHDLRNYVGKPSALAALILAENPSEKVKEYARLITASASAQSDFIEGFLNLSREEEEIAKKVFRVRTFHFGEITQTVREKLAEKLRAKNITLNIHNTDEEVYLKMESEMLGSVLYNIVENAVKFSNPGSEIDLEVKKRHGQLEIKVTDQGIGFEDIDPAEFFKKFTKWGRIGTAGEKSTGIGLYLCSQILRRAEGNIYAESPGAGKGAAFHVSLKLYKKH